MEKSKQRAIEPEFLDVVDENDKVVGRATREKVHRIKMWHRVAHVLVLNSAGELLLPCRSPTKRIAPNLYDCSISEHLVSGESAEGAAARGLNEELRIENPKPKFVSKFRATYGTDESKTISILYEFRYDGKINIDKNEVKSIEFMSGGKIKHMLVKDDTRFAPWAAELLKWYFHLPAKLEKIG